MIKTYRRDEDGVLFYREAWQSGDVLVLHEGKAGTKGKQKSEWLKSRDMPHKLTPDQAFDKFKAEAAAAGFAEEEEHGWVVLQCWSFSPGLSHPEDERLLDDGVEALTDYLGWRGIGKCDGYDIGGTPPEEYGLDGVVLNLFCPVVDTEIGVQVVRRFAKEFNIAQKYVVGAREAGEDTDYVLAWSPRKGDKEFHL